VDEHEVEVAGNDVVQHVAVGVHLVVVGVGVEVVLRDEPGE
jgi:hypothetical protein